MILYRLINIGLSEKDSALYRLRQKALSVFNFINLFFLSFYSIRMVIASAELYQAKVNFIAVGLVIVSLILSHYRKLNVAAFVTGFLAIYATSNLMYFEGPVPNRISPVFGTITAFITLVIKRLDIRTLFILTSTFLVGFIVYDISDDLWLTAKILREDLLFAIGFFVFTFYLEKIDLKLTETLTSLEESNNEKLILNKELKQRNEDLVTFTYIMTHDLKTPILSINGFSKIIEKKIKSDDPKLMEYFSIIQNSSNSMQSLIDDLLEYMKLDQVSSLNQIVNLNKLVDEVIESFKFELSEKKGNISREDLPEIYGNSQLIKTVLQNLISNAIKYQPKDNEDHFPKVYITGSSSENYHRMIIKDNGIGIEQEYISNLFEPFKKFHNELEYKGSGLGMSICQRAMKKMEGEIRLKETSKNGSIFELKFHKNIKSK